jgi:hypothetical protein
LAGNTLTERHAKLVDKVSQRAFTLTVINQILLADNLLGNMRGATKPINKA